MKLSNLLRYKIWLLKLSHSSWVRNIMFMLCLISKVTKVLEFLRWGRNKGSIWTLLCINCHSHVDHSLHIRVLFN